MKNEPLAAWLKTNGVKRYHLAAECGFDTDSLRRWEVAGKIPRSMAMAIELYTKGGVTLRDWGME